MSKKRINWIENIKIIAMFGVIIFHFWIFYHAIPTDLMFFFNDWKSFLSLPLQIGWHGNFLFFMMSGIGLTLFAENKKILWINFFISRLKRIYIPYWISISAMLIAQIIIFKINILDLPSNSLGWIYNFLLIYIPGVPKFYSHYWFLFIMVQLYILFPLLYWFSKRTKIGGVIIVTVIHIAFKKCIGIIPGANWVPIFIWVIPFYYGIYLGSNLYQDREKTERLLNKYFPLGFILWIIGIVLSYNPNLECASYPFISIGSFMTIYKIANYNWSFPELNKIFYEVYLIHFPIFIASCNNIAMLAQSPKYVIFIYYIISTYIMAVGINYVSNRIIRYTQVDKIDIKF